ncbi:MAG: ATP-binding domain-containing protein, partial [Oscillospiraceae bacterium]
TKDNDFFFLQRNNETAVMQTVVGLVSERLPRTYGYSPIADIQVLTPQRQGELGVHAINNRLQEVINPKSASKKEFKGLFCTFREGDKVMQIKNNYDMEWTKKEETGLGVFNGDIGIIKMIDTPTATIVIDFEDRICNYSFEMAVELELAYAVTIHKSQGSEYDAVVLPIFGGYDKLYFRNLLYTAVTRAKKMLIVVGSRNRVDYMVQNNRKMLRYTNLRGFICEAVTHEK